ncbi:MAG: hypothetical protein Edafosvirus10_8 [Edafosvirus sp.]|uniref:RING-type domain-containing protein n=1 Tax=Edafosvirus sp. TaxID=2487765 RepID=A0A3G4ZXL1_9VIRU|nr:MAG: hypothetical protein Edafosvirus10_8 [Edafosvirus sp.]
MNKPLEFQDDILLEVVLTSKYGWLNIGRYYQIDDCQICLECLKDTYVLILPCDHVFHKNCILKNIVEYKRYKCPQCPASKDFEIIKKN